MSDDANNTPTPNPQPSDWEATDRANAQLQAKLFDLNKAAVFNALALASITHVVVTFDGYGDSGQIENIEVRNGDNQIAMPDALIEIAEAVWGEAEPRLSSVSLAAAVESLVYDVLEQTHGGWENDDGAYGDVTFDVEERTITLDYNERYTSCENFTHTF